MYQNLLEIYHSCSLNGKQIHRTMIRYKPDATIRWQLCNRSLFRDTVYDINGEEIVCVIDESEPA